VEELQSELETLRSSLDDRTSALFATEKKLQGLQSGSKEDDAVTTLKASHDLELSQQAERVRSLESSLHAAENRVHQLTRQLSDVQLSSPSSGPSRGYFLTDGDGPSSSGRAPGQPSRPTGVDALLPAHVRHKRQVSLSALKARMEPTRRVTSSAMVNLNEDDESQTGGASSAGGTPMETKTKKSGRAQFGDEIVYCCPACDGDLITL
jgi:hypothetical protein